MLSWQPRGAHTPGRGQPAAPRQLYDRSETFFATDMSGIERLRCGHYSRAGLYPGPRSTRPGLAPVICPSEITGTPFTSTQRIPVASSFGELKVERSAMVAG